MIKIYLQIYCCGTYSNGFEIMNDDSVKESIKNDRATHPEENFNVSVNSDALKPANMKDALKYNYIPTPDQNDLHDSERIRPTSDSKPAKEKQLHSTNDSNSTDKNKKDITIPEYPQKNVPKFSDQHEIKPYVLEPKSKKVNQRTKDDEITKRIKRQINIDNNKSKFDSDLDREMIPDGI